MPIERLNPGTFRHQKFGVPGGYLVRCSEYPSVAISVIVVDSPFFAVVDDRGAFSIPGVPDTKATLKVWAGGRWVYHPYRSWYWGHRAYWHPGWRARPLRWHRR